VSTDKGWQRTNIQVAATYLRERIATGATDPRTRAIYEGLLDVLDPTRRATRLQREAAHAAKSAVTVQATRERRAHHERRAARDRRVVNLGPPSGVERRSGGDRRAGQDRRNR
jgi:hypothetical protein